MSILFKNALDKASEKHLQALPCCMKCVFSLQGINLVQDLIDEYSLNVIQAYMAHIQVQSECCG